MQSVLQGILQLISHITWCRLATDEVRQSSQNNTKKKEEIHKERNKRKPRKRLSLSPTVGQSFQAVLFSGVVKLGLQDSGPHVARASAKTRSMGISIQSALSEFFIPNTIYCMMNPAIYQTHIFTPLDPTDY